MNPERSTAIPGRTRVCPHCKSVILESADICPACHHHLRIGQQVERRAALRVSAFRVEGTFQHQAASAAEYTVVIAIRNAAGQEIKRQVIDVGAIEPGDQRTFNLSVDISPPRR